MTREDSILPANPERERQFIGALLWHRDARERDAVVAETPESTFADTVCRKAFNVLREMREAGTLGDQLHATIRLTERVGAEVAGELMADGGVQGTALEEWQQELKGLAHRRAVIQTCRAAIAEAAEGRDAAEIEGDLAEARSRHLAEFIGQRAAPISDAVDRFEVFCADMAERQREGHALRFGIEAVDTRALWIPSYGLIVARTSHGKTAMAANLALNLARQGKSPVYFSLEQPAHQLVGRLVSLLIGRPLAAAMGQCDDRAASVSRAEALGWLRSSRLTLVEGPHTAEQIAATASRLAARNQCDALFIDQMSRIDHRQGRSETKEQAWTRTSNRLALLWQEIQVPVVLLAQLNPKLALHGVAPCTSHIKDCGSLLEDACWVLLLDRPEADEDRFKQLEKGRQALEAAKCYGEANECDVRNRIFLHCAKDRNSTMGGVWTVRLGFDRQSGAIGDPAERPVLARGVASEASF